jgi:hypothetical protein
VDDTANNREEVLRPHDCFPSRPRITIYHILDAAVVFVRHAIGAGDPAPALGLASAAGGRRAGPLGANVASNVPPNSLHDTPWMTREFALYDLDRNALIFYRPLKIEERMPWYVTTYFPEGFPAPVTKPRRHNFLRARQPLPRCTGI